MVKAVNRMRRLHRGLECRSHGSSPSCKKPLQEPLDITKDLSIQGVNEFRPRRDDAARPVNDGARLAAA